MRSRPLALAGLVLHLALCPGLDPGFARPVLRADALSRTETEVWTWSAIWDAMKQLAALLKNGSGVDPFGNPQGTGNNLPPSTTGDNGSGIDPFGGK